MADSAKPTIMFGNVPLKIEMGADDVVARCWLPDGTEVFEGDEIYLDATDGSVHVRRKPRDALALK